MLKIGQRVTADTRGIGRSVMPDDTDLVGVTDGRRYIGDIMTSRPRLLETGLPARHSARVCLNLHLEGGWPGGRAVHGEGGGSTGHNLTWLEAGAIGLDLRGISGS